MMDSIVEFEHFRKTLRLSALAARICYSSSDLNVLLEDEKVAGEKINAFLVSLIKRKHLSVFAHSFCYVDCLMPSLATKIGATHFKSIFMPPTIVGLSLRHFIERNRDKAIEALESCPVELLGTTAIMKSEEYNGLLTALIHKDDAYDGWASIYISGISRITSHQLVRHTSLNFCQRSQRYTIDSALCSLPGLNYLSEEARATCQDQIIAACEAAQSTYRELLGAGVHKEDARFILPEASHTALLASGSLKQWQAYIDQRVDSKAQAEHRQLANQVKALLFS